MLLTLTATAETQANVVQMDEIARKFHAQADRYYRRRFSGRGGWVPLRRALIKQLDAYLRSAPPSSQLLSLRASLAVKGSTCRMWWQRMLDFDPTNAEALSELALLSAEERDHDEVLRLGRAALRSSAASDIEEIVIYNVLDAAKKAGVKGLINRARRLGQKRFPLSSLFHDDNARSKKRG